MDAQGISILQSDGLLEWGPQLETGIESIDAQHKILVDMCNQANHRLRDRIDKDFVEQVVHDLMSYALYHFEQEEELMLDNAYLQHAPDMASRHLAEHRGFSETVAAVQHDLALGKLISREALMGFLNGWLVNHIMNTDMALARYLHRQHAT